MENSKVSEAKFDFFRVTKGIVTSEVIELQAIFIGIVEELKRDIDVGSTKISDKEAQRAHVKLRTEQAATVAQAIAGIKLQAVIAATQSEALAVNMLASRASVPQMADVAKKMKRIADQARERQAEEREWAAANSLQAIREEVKAPIG
jgi:hypothetical protein